LLDLHRIEILADVRAALVELTRGASKIQLGPRARWAMPASSCNLEHRRERTARCPHLVSRPRSSTSGLPPEESCHVIANNFIDTSFGGDVLYRHSWNDAGRFRDAPRSSFELRARSRGNRCPKAEMSRNQPG
jgi:hypothetical protein